MNKELDLNLNSSVAETNSIETKDYVTYESDLFFDINCFEIPNTACWNMFEAKNEDLSNFSIKGDYSQDKAGIFSHGETSLDNTLGVSILQDNLIEARSYLELKSDTVLINNEEFLENNYCAINGELVEEQMGLNLEDNGLSFGTCLEGCGTINTNLFGGDKLEVKDTNTLFSNKPVTVAFSAKQQDVFFEENSDLGAVASKNIFDGKASTYSGLDTLKGLQAENPYFQNGVMDIDATYEHEEVVVKDIGNSLH